MSNGDDKTEGDAMMIARLRQHQLEDALRRLDAYVLAMQETIQRIKERRTHDGK